MCGCLSSPKRGQSVEWKAVDDFDKCAIRTKVHQFYTVRRQLPTLQKLHDVLVEDINFAAGKSKLLFFTS